MEVQIKMLVFPICETGKIRIKKKILWKKKKKLYTKFKVEWEQVEEDRREREHRFLAAHPLNLFSVFEDITTVCLVGGQLGVPTGGL